MSHTITLTVSPSQIEQDVKNDLVKAFPDDASKEKAADEMSKAMNDPEVKKRAYEDVKKLAETIRSIRSGFLKVAGDFVSFDAAGFKDDYGNLIQLGQDWEPYRKFDETLQYSLEQATGSITFMKSVVSVLGEVEPTNTRDLRLELENFIKNLEPKEKIAKEVKDKFTAITDGVRLFTAKIDAALDKAEEAIKIVLEKARKRLTELNEKLKQVNQRIEVLSRAVTREASVGATAAGVAIATLNPFAIFAAIVYFISSESNNTRGAVFEAEEDKARTENEVAIEDKNITDLQARSELLKRYRGNFEDTKVLLRDIAIKIETIANIWQTINLDMCALHQDLELNFSKDAPMTWFFLKKLKNGKGIYSHLVYLLETYVAEVTAANND